MLRLAAHHGNASGREVRLRQVWRTPGFTATALLTLSLGIGMTTAIFSVHAVLLQPVPFPEPGRLVAMWETNTSQLRYGTKPASIPDFAGYRNGSGPRTAQPRLSGRADPTRPIAHVIVDSGSSVRP